MMASRSSKRQRRSTIHPANATQTRNTNINRHVSHELHELEPKHGGDRVLNRLSPHEVESNSNKIDGTQVAFGTLSTAIAPPRQSDNVSTNKITTCRPLHNFFGPASTEQRWRFAKPREAEAREPSTNRIECDDIIDDYDSFDELFTQLTDDGALSEERPMSFSDNREPLHEDSTETPAIHQQTYVHPPKRFKARLPGGNGNNRPHSPRLQGDRLPWTQRYAPVNLNELAVHKKKVSDVESWLKDAFQGNARCKLLVLRGPAGSGKSITVDLLSHALNFEILEWKSPPASDQYTEGYISLAKKFDEFLGRGDSFGGLDLDNGSPTRNIANFHARRIMLIEEFPSLNQSSSGLAAFRISLQRRLATSFPVPSMGQGQQQRNRESNTPIVVIVSETNLNSGPSIPDNITVYRLLGPEIYNHPCTTILDFKSIAPTFMLKALNLVINKHTRLSGNTTDPGIPGTPMLRSISKSGDIRNAVNALEFLCIGSPQVKGMKPCYLKDKKIRGRSEAKRAAVEKETLELVTQREISLGIFHAVGKIMYNKREESNATPENQQLPSPPDHIYQYDRPKTSQVSVNHLADEMGTDIQTFISTLHENYVQSCDCTTFMDCLNGCIDALSDSDILCGDNKRFTGSRMSAGIGSSRASSGIDMLRQDELSYQVATRGILFSLPYPVKRCSIQAGRLGRAGDAHKMYFPSSFRVMQSMEEIEGLTKLWARRLMDPSSGRIPKPLRDVNAFQPLKESGQVALSDDGKAQPIIVTMIPRMDLLLYQLPYLATLSHYQEEAKDLKTITGFWDSKTRIDFDGDSCDHALDKFMESSLGQDTQLTPQWESSKECNNAFGPRLPLGYREEDKLILSDDDILDD